MILLFKYFGLFGLLLLCTLVSGCESPSAIETPIAESKYDPPADTPKEVAYAFGTEHGETITVVQDDESGVTYAKPVSTLDSRLIDTPLQICKDNYIIDIGYASADVGEDVNSNIYAVIYESVIDEYLNDPDYKSNDALREVLNDYTKVYPDVTYHSNDAFADVAPNSTVWSDAVVDLSSYTNIERFKLPIVSASYRLNSGEYLVAHCYADTSSGAWAIKDIPAYLDVALSNEYSDISASKYSSNISTMAKAYDECKELLASQLGNIYVKDMSSSYAIVPLNDKLRIQSTYGIDVSQYDAYAFVTIEDMSVYFVHMRNEVIAVECVVGDSTHDITASGDKYATKLVDNDTGEEYNFDWIYK